MNQIIITRRDLKLPLHEEISEACNAASDFMYKYEQHRHVQRWKREFGAGKVSVGIDSERELLLLCDKAEGLGVPFMKSFKPCGTLTCAVIGPYESDVVDEVCGELKLR